MTREKRNLFPLEEEAVRLADAIRKGSRIKIDLPILGIPLLCRVVHIRELVEGGMLPLLRMEIDPEASPEDLQLEAEQLIATGRNLLISVCEAPRIRPEGVTLKPGEISALDISDEDIGSALGQLFPPIAARIYRINPASVDLDKEFALMERQDELLALLDALCARYGGKWPHDLLGMTDEDPSALALDISALAAGERKAKKAARDRGEDV